MIPISLLTQLLDIAWVVLNWCHLFVQLKPVHPFVTARLTEPASSHEVQTLLALYRAQGGRLPPASHSPTPLVPPVTPAPPPAAPTDALDPSHHQRLAVLFCSYSHESINAPDFCVNPWWVTLPTFTYLCYLKVLLLNKYKTISWGYFEILYVLLFQPHKNLLPSVSVLLK